MSVNLVNQTDASLAPIAGGTLYADEPIGAILPFGGSTVPNGFLLCNGAAVSRTTYVELFEVIGTSFGAGDGSTTFNIPDLREATVKGTGLTSKSNNHLDAEGLTLGEFIDDRIQSHTHTYTNVHNGTNPSYGRADFTGSAPEKYNFDGFTLTSSAPTGRSGTTTEVKAVGVNFIIKALEIALPTDFEDAVDDKIAANMIDSVTDGSQKAITSNAVFDQLKNFCMTVQASGSLTIAANSQQGISLTYTCPQGYTPILAVPRSAGSWAWVWSYCYLQDTSHVYAVIKSVINNQETQTITANVLCVRTYS